MTNPECDAAILRFLNGSKGGTTFNEICVGLGIPRAAINKTHSKAADVEASWRQADRRLQALKRATHVYFDKQNRVWRLSA